MSLTYNTQSFSEDQTLQKFGYQQEYKRELKRFASFAVGFSFISTTNLPPTTLTLPGRCILLSHHALVYLIPDPFPVQILGSIIREHGCTGGYRRPRSTEVST